MTHSFPTLRSSDLPRTVWGNPLMVPLPLVEVARDAEALARHVADWFVERIAETPGGFALCLSGGSTPRRPYALLASPGYRKRLPWHRLHLFWGDERNVPADHPDSNYRVAHEARSEEHTPE